MLFNEQVYNIPRNVKINDVSLLGTASVMRVWLIHNSKTLQKSAQKCQGTVRIFIFYVEITVYTILLRYTSYIRRIVPVKPIHFFEETLILGY